MLSKYAGVSVDVSDKFTMLELDTATSILNEHYEDLKKQASKRSDFGSQDTQTLSTAGSSDDIMDLLP